MKIIYLNKSKLKIHSPEKSSHFIEVKNVYFISSNDSLSITSKTLEKKRFSVFRVCRKKALA